MQNLKQFYKRITLTTAEMNIPWIAVAVQICCLFLIGNIIHFQIKTMQVIQFFDETIDSRPTQNRTDYI